MTLSAAFPYSPGHVARTPFRCRGHRRRPCRHGSRGRRGAHGRGHGARHHERARDRRHVLQPRHRGGWARGIWCARSTPWTVSWRGPSTARASSSACSMPARARPCAARAPRPIATATPRAVTGLLARQRGARYRRGGGRRSGAGSGRDGRRCRSRRWPPLRLRRLCRDHGHLSARGHPSRRGELAGRALGRPPGAGPGQHPGALRLRSGAGSRPAPRRAWTAAASISAAVEVQPGDVPPRPFSTLTETIPLPQIACHVTHTTPATHAIVRANLERSAVYGGRIAGPGPRYCPSIEDKVARFADRTSHRLFLEPEGLEDRHGLPQRHLHLAAGGGPGGRWWPRFPAWSGSASRATATPSSMTSWTRASSPTAWRRGAFPVSFWPGRSTAPRATKRRRDRAWWPGSTPRAMPEAASRSSSTAARAYLGVMIDDLVTRGVSEPYRMFTSRAEYRLLLRADNADLRLTAKGMAAGCVSTERARAFEARRAAVEGALTAARALSLTPDAARRRGPAGDAGRQAPDPAPSWRPMTASTGHACWPCGRGWRPGRSMSGSRSRSPAAMPATSTACTPTSRPSGATKR